MSNGEGEDDDSLYLTVMIVTDKSFQQHEGLGIADFDDLNTPLAKFQARQTESYSSFKKRVAQELGHSIQQFRLWKLGRAGEGNSSGLMAPVEKTHRPGQSACAFSLQHLASPADPPSFLQTSGRSTTTSPTRRPSCACTSTFTTTPDPSPWCVSPRARLHAHSGRC